MRRILLLLTRDELVQLSRIVEAVVERRGSADQQAADP